MKLVTGATGMVGAHLILQLLRNEPVVRAIYRHENSIKKTQSFFKLKKSEDLFLKIEWVKADLLDVPALEIAFQNITEVYHCAALVSFDPRDEKVLRQTNIEGTANLVNLAIAFEVEKFCHVSSIAALGETLAKNKIINEKTNWNPELYHSDYAITKYGAEMEVWRGTQEGLKVIIVNPGIIFGQGFNYEGSNEFFQKIKKDFPFYTNGTAAIVSAEDVVNAMIHLMDSDLFNEKYIVVANNITYQELLNYIAELMNKKPPFIFATKWLCRIAWRLDAFISLISGKKRSFTKAIALSSHSKYTYDNQKLLQVLPFTLKSYQEFIPEIIQYHYTKK
ncbi:MULTISPECIES: NAD-dependent epimerase/dehydratase family protein [Myroides]|uniref:NAD-dependent epimerase/dehydratase family protein n=1 Tax=Myroides albus TaxID=2562892 RepID=A0A6I3LQ21_9FLAO|nr:MULTISPECIES: NAD-dependent epimerase/dehydratase family protein [Myroides]MTG98055.1 NAD-dependent epimerase/dehydratase family protein [Myroides albus]MVX36307.1 NAD-dependent epimerase/dehydratase family protein [Myroides sp. LoEW2-1]UVD80765.1 NAD-dependent epimerase/dehydratase family protein [Myroides albus]